MVKKLNETILKGKNFLKVGALAALLATGCAVDENEEEIGGGDSGYTTVITDSTGQEVDLTNFTNIETDLSREEVIDALCAATEVVEKKHSIKISYEGLNYDGPSIPCKNFFDNTTFCTEYAFKLNVELKSNAIKCIDEGTIAENSGKDYYTSFVNCMGDKDRYYYDDEIEKECAAQEEEL